MNEEGFHFINSVEAQGSTFIAHFNESGLCGVNML